jgi:Na+-driven multidrug efflux pump
MATSGQHASAPLAVKAGAVNAMTISTHSRFAADVRAICVLALPLIGNNLSVIGMQFADTVMAGQLGRAIWPRSRSASASITCSC